MTELRTSVGPAHIAIGTRRVPHRAIRLLLFLLPVWLFGAGELARFALNNMHPGPFERDGIVKGHDFVTFYTLGTLAREGDWSALYDIRALERAMPRAVPGAGGIPAPFYGPQVALFFAPFSRLPFLQARWLWCGVSVIVYLLGAALVINRYPALKAHASFVWPTVVLNPAFAVLLETGQAGAFSVLMWASAIVALADRRLFLFGASLGLLAFKPPLLIGVVAALVILWEPAALAGVIASGAFQGAVALVGTGFRPWRDYVVTLMSVSRYYFLTDTLPDQKQSMPGFFQLVFGRGTISDVLSGIAIAAVLALWWRDRKRRRNEWFVPLIATTAVIVSPHFYVYDLVVLTPALLVVAAVLCNRLERQAERVVAWSGYAVLFAPYSGVIAARTHIQLSAIALLLLFLGMSAAARQQDNVGAAQILSSGI